MAFNVCNVNHVSYHKCNCQINAQKNCHVTYTNDAAKGMTWAFNNRLKQMTKSETFEPNSLGKNKYQLNANQRGANNHNVAGIN
jgi:hypothetical protein